MTKSKPLRRDAELNLARILVAARDVFAEHGYEASMEQIAARAEVGIGTLYRRFPNKADLCAAVVDAATDRTRQIANEVILEVTPGEAVFEFVRRCVEAPSCWRAATSRRPWSGGDADRALATAVAAHRADPRGQPAGRHGPARHRPHRSGGDLDVSQDPRRSLRHRRSGGFSAVPRARPRWPTVRAQVAQCTPRCRSGSWAAY